MWKVLLMISAVVLLGSGVFSYMNKNSLKTVNDDREQKESDLQASLDNLETKRKDLADTQAEAISLKAEYETLKTELAQAELKSTNNDLEIANLTMEEKTISEALTKAKVFVDKIQDIKKLQQEMAERATQIQEEEVAIANLRGQVSDEEVKGQAMDATRVEMQAVADDRKKGIIRGEFATTVKKAFNNWGFVVIDAGDNEGVVNKAQLDVLRRGQPICKLLVTAVEPAEAVAEVISGSLQPGQAIQEGDVVTKSTTIIPNLGPNAMPTPSVAPPAGGAGAGGEGADPTGILPPADMAPGGAGGDPDPFAPAGGGGMAPATEPDPFAPAPAAPAGDGGGMAPPAAGGGAEADPFAPATPAAPAGGPGMDGGTAEPDPFAPKPDAGAEAPATGGTPPAAGDPFAPQ